MAGVIATRDALELAKKRGMDLVEVSPNADPPVCRVMDFGKFQYEENRKRREAKKHQQTHSVKEIKFHPSTEEHDYQTKLGHVRDFLARGHKVKLTLTYRGRENAHKERGVEFLDRAIRDCAEVSVLDMPPKRIGRSLTAMLGVKAGK
jgi:translation initiation factor IF-3